MTGLFRNLGAVIRLPGHRSYSGPASARVTDNQAEMLPLIRAERARRALYADCERAPVGWEGR
jgi:hypothetical protein